MENSKQLNSRIIQISTDQNEEEVQNEIDRVLSNNDDPIQAKYLVKQYVPQVNVLQKLTFGVKPKEIFGIIGPNGAGKSTLINLLTGLQEKTSGDCFIKNKKLEHQSMDSLLHIGICTQNDCLWENLTPVEHLRLFGKMKGLKEGNLNQFFIRIGELQSAIKYFIDTMQLNYFVNTKAGNLSGGNKRKLCVADALIGGTDLAFFDEPSTGVDPLARRFLFNTLRNNVKLRDASVLMTTQTIDEAEQLCDRIAILINGKFHCLGSPEQLRKYLICEFILSTQSKYGTGYTIQLELVEVKFDLSTRSMITENFQNAKFLEDKREKFVTFSLNEEKFSFFRTFEFLENLISKQAISDFSINHSSIEQIFLHLSKTINSGQK